MSVNVLGKQKITTKQKIFNQLSLSSTHVSVSDLGHKFYYVCFNFNTKIHYSVFFFSERKSFVYLSIQNWTQAEYLKYKCPYLIKGIFTNYKTEDLQSKKIRSGLFLIQYLICCISLYHQYHLRKKQITVIMTPFCARMKSLHTLN